MIRRSLLLVLVALGACMDDETGARDAAGDASDTTTASDTAPDSTPPAPDTAPAEDTAPAPDAAPDTSTAPDTKPEPDTAPAEDTAADTAPPADTAPETTADTTPDDIGPGCVCSERRPLILVHGINGAPSNFDVMVPRLLADGWPEDWIVRFEAADPAWGCNVDNAAAIDELVEQVRARTCQARVDVVAHSMGTLSSRYYIKNLGGQEVVNTYVTLGGMHHGLFSPCLAPDFLGVCTWQELCQSGDFIAQLNADPATPGELHWVSIYGTGDTTVPNESSHLDGAENVVIEGAEHDGPNGLVQREDVYAEVKRVLGYSCW